MGQCSPSHHWDKRGHSLFLLTLVRAREARVWVEVEDRAHELRLQGPRGLFTPSHHILSQLINQ